MLMVLPMPGMAAAMPPPATFSSRSTFRPIVGVSSVVWKMDEGVMPLSSARVSCPLLLGSVSRVENGMVKISPVLALMVPLSKPMVIVVLKSESGPASRVPVNWFPPDAVGTMKKPLKKMLRKTTNLKQKIESRLKTTSMMIIF